MVVPGNQRFEFSLLWSRKATWMAELSGSDRTWQGLWCGMLCVWMEKWWAEVMSMSCRRLETGPRWKRVCWIERLDVGGPSFDV